MHDDKKLAGRTRRYVRSRTQLHAAKQLTKCSKRPGYVHLDLERKPTHRLSFRVLIRCILIASIAS